MRREVNVDVTRWRAIDIMTFNSTDNEDWQDCLDDGQSHATSAMTPGVQQQLLKPWSPCDDGQTDRRTDVLENAGHQLHGILTTSNAVQSSMHSHGRPSVSPTAAAEPRRSPMTFDWIRLSRNLFIRLLVRPNPASPRLLFRDSNHLSYRQWRRYADGPIDEGQNIIELT